MADEFNSNGRSDGWESFAPWIPTLIMLFCFWPVGLAMLFYKLFGGQRASSSRHPYDAARNAAHQAAGEAKAAARAATEEARSAGRKAAEEAKAAARAATEEARTAGRKAAEEAKAAARAATEEARSAGQQAAEAAKGAARQGTQAAKSAAYRTAPPPRAAQKGPLPKRDKRDWALRRKADGGRGLAIGGGVLAGVFGLVSMTELVSRLSMEGLAGLIPALADVFILMGFCGGGLVMVYYGLRQIKLSKRYRKYLALIGKRESISVDSLAAAMGVSGRRACDDLQDMLDAGLFPTGFLDVGAGRLILSDEGLREESTEAAQAEPEEEAAPQGMERENAVLNEIREVNDAIPDAEMSRKIDRIGEITGKIFAYLREKPDKEGQLRSFLSYYLPTTLKILRAYAQMDAQGIEGANITAAKERIEGMMDKVVDGFEKQLDKLFQDDAMDITTDVAVLEQMLDKDGLGGGQGLRLGG